MFNNNNTQYPTDTLKKYSTFDFLKTQLFTYNIYFHIVNAPLLLGTDYLVNDNFLFHQN